MPKRTEPQAKPTIAARNSREPYAPLPLATIPEGVIGYSGTLTAEKSAKIIDIKKPNRLYSLVLENEKKEFVGYLTARFGVDPEVAIQAYEQLSSRFNHEASTRPPEIAPELYAEREDKFEKPLTFLKRIYGQWLEGNGLYQFTLRRIDPVLMDALDSGYRKAKRAELVALLPTKQLEVSERIGEFGEMTPVERKRKAQTALRSPN